MFIHMNMLHSKTFEHRRYDSNPFQVVSDCESPKVPSHQCRVETRIADGSLGLYILNNMSQLFFSQEIAEYIPTNISPHISQQYFRTIYPHNPPNPSKSLNISRVTRHWTSLRKRMTSWPARGREKRPRTADFTTG